MFKPDLNQVMKENGFNNQHKVYQNLLRNVSAADFDTAARSDGASRCHDVEGGKRDSV
ncbi:hypothetical protein [Pseudomonas sp. P8_241]|uniref:hypothetical protein n=1 Tax=Pseudomonas sp. P8_241 TaxID=3043445 RepID=UPI002A36518C|nr:hypothetical protein [Pseudomonas sp. P8_241]WPN45118.1 hypothetical protein QMK58_18225 [Pseudomonas sp. P8_241]